MQKSRGTSLKKLGNDIHINISKFLKTCDIFSLALTSSKLEQSLKSDPLWRQLILRDFGFIHPSFVSLITLRTTSTTSNSTSNWFQVYKLYSEKVYIAVHETNDDPEQILKIFPTKEQAAEHLHSLFSGHQQTVVTLDEEDLQGLNVVFLNTLYVRCNYLFSKRPRTVAEGMKAVHNSKQQRVTYMLKHNPTFKVQLDLLNQRIKDKIVRLLCNDKTFEDWSDNKFYIITENMFTKIGKKL